MKTSGAISIIGGADGPTSIFIAGRISPSGIAISCAAVIGIILLLIFVIRMIMKRRK